MDTGRYRNDNSKFNKRYDTTPIDIYMIVLMGVATEDLHSLASLMGLCHGITCESWTPTNR
jgi:hypothetical protein